MKFIKSALAGIALCAVSLSSNAYFSGSLSGPSTLQAGQSGTFELMLQYNPIDISTFGTDFDGLNGMLEYSHFSIEANIGYSYVQKTGALYGTPTTASLNVSHVSPSYHPVGYTPDPFDQNAPAIIKTTFSWLSGDVGLYEMLVSVNTVDVIARVQTPLCLATPNCAHVGQLNDLNVYRGGTQAIFNVLVIPTQIPESKTYALMLAGLGIVGIVASRKKQKV